MTQVTDPQLTEDPYLSHRRERGLTLAKAIQAAKALPAKEQPAAITKAKADYASGAMKLAYPDVLTKRYRLLWDEKGQLYGDPEEPHEAGSTTAGGPDYCFESDDLKAVRETVKELRLTYSPDSGADLSEDWYEHKKLDH